MKILKWLLVVLGLAGLIGAGVFTYLGWSELQKLVAAAESTGSAPQANPQQQVLIAIGLAVVGGFVLGLGMAMPRRTVGKIRNETLQSVAVARDSEIRQRATNDPGRPADPMDRREQEGEHGNPR